MTALKPAFVALLVSLALVGCNDKDDDGGTTSDFDRTAMLTNLADNRILPAYENLEQQLTSLNNDLGAFVSNADQTTYDQLLASFQAAYLSWEVVTVYEFGPAEDQLFRARMNTFPTDEARIEDNITNGGYNLETPGNFGASGLPAVDYLLRGSLTEVDARLISGAQATEYRQYLTDVVNKMIEQTELVRQGWATNGQNYRGVFINSTGVDIGSSMGQLVNNFSQEIELSKNARVGIPLGKKTLGVTLPDQVESFHLGFSLELVSANMRAMQGLFRGTSLGGTDGSGIMDNLAAIDGGSSLANDIDAKFTEILDELDDLNGRLSDLVDSDPTAVEEAYDALQELVILVKTDLTSLMGIQITYQDNDGD